MGFARENGSRPGPSGKASGLFGDWPFNGTEHWDVTRTLQCPAAWVPPEGVCLTDGDPVWVGRGLTVSRGILICDKISWETPP